MNRFRVMGGTISEHRQTDNDGKFIRVAFTANLLGHTAHSEECWEAIETVIHHVNLIRQGHEQKMLEAIEDEA